MKAQSHVMRSRPGTPTREPLDALLFRRGPLKSSEAVALVTSIAAAIDEMHAHGAVHGDVRPRTILVDEMGVARLLPATAMPLRDGDQRYAAPERLKGRRASPRGDVYALGLVAYEIIAGRPAYATSHDATRTAARVAAGVPRLADEIPGIAIPVSQAVAHATALAETQRPPTAGDFAREFSSAIRASDPTEPFVRLRPRSDRGVWSPNSIHWPVAIPAVLVLLGVMNVLNAGAFRSSSTSASPTTGPSATLRVPTTTAPKLSGGTLVVASGTTPDVAGMFWRDASKVLRERGFRNDIEVSVEPSASGQAGRVLRQEPAAGAPFRSGEKARLFVVGPLRD